jgi:CHAT domain-containing protein/Tfp pilus assembly protein PilF
LAVRKEIDDQILVGRALNTLGSAYMYLGQIYDAIEYYVKAATLRCTTGDVEGFAGTAAYINALCTEEAKFFSLERSFRELAETARSGQRPEFELVCRNYLIRYYRNSGRFRLAFEQADIAKSLLGTARSKKTVYWFHLYYGQLNMSTGELDAASAEFQRSLEAARQVDNESLILDALINLAHCDFDRGDRDAARQRAKDILISAREYEDFPAETEALFLLAELELFDGNFDASKTYYKVLIDLYTECGESDRLIEAELGMAHALGSSGQGSEALATYRRLRPEIILQEQAQLILSLYSGFGNAFEVLDADSAYYYYEKTLEMVDNARREVPGPEIRTGFLGGDNRHLFEEIAFFYSRTAKKTGDEKWIIRAFNTAERSKARGLLDMLTNNVLAGMTEEEEAVLDSLYGLDWSSPKYNDDFDHLIAEYAKLRDTRLGDGLGVMAKPIQVETIQNVQSILSGNTVMFSYLLGDTTSLLWVITPDRLETHWIPGRDTLATYVEALRSAIKVPGAKDNQLRETSFLLYQLLIESAAGNLNDVSTIIVSPDGVLFELPFELLMMEARRGTSWKDAPFLVRKYSTVYAPSATIYAKLQEHADRRYDNELFAAGDADYSQFPTANGFLPLAASRSALARINAMLGGGGTLIFGAEANETAIKNFLRSGSYRFVHLATHGISDSREPAQSRVVFSPDNDADEDGYLHLLEILTLNCTADVVVLEACESARGQIGRGEGVVGLSRSFIASGAGSVVASLWKVTDDSASELMTSFYSNLVDQNPTYGEAMQNARCDMLDNNRHPYFWAPFILIGPGASGR